LDKNHNKNVSKKDVLYFVDLIEKYIKKSYNITISILPCRSKKYKSTMKWLKKSNTDIATNNNILANTGIKEELNKMRNLSIKIDNHNFNTNGEHNVANFMCSMKNNNNNKEKKY